MSDSPLLSIIIPAYNAEATLDACLRSICASTLRDWEVLLIDDGSADGTAALADAWAQKEKRISVLHRPNGGRSAARNDGLERAQGRYTAFIDADDTVTPDYLQHLTDTAETHGADIVVCGFTYLLTDGRREEHPACAVTELKEATPELFSTLPKGVCTHFYRSAAIRAAAARFPLGIPFGEDTCFHYLVYPYCRRVVLSPECGYLYLQAEETGERVFARRHADSLADAAALLVDAYAARGLLPEHSATAVHFAAHALARILARCPLADIPHPTDTLRAALTRAGIRPDNLPPLPAKHRALLQRLLRGGTGLTLRLRVKHLLRTLTHRHRVS